MTWYNPLTWFRNKKSTENDLDQPERLEGQFMVIQAGFEDDGRLRLEVEYDDVFVAALRKRGYVGVDDHQLVMQYVGDVYRTITTNADVKTYD